jgi:hypothetical protein
MNGRSWIRQFHRWVSLAFTLTVIANFVAMAIGRGAQPPPWITFSPLLPLALLMFTGLYMFVSPYLGKSRAAGLASGAVDATRKPTPAA